MTASDAAAGLHERTKHTWERLRTAARTLDWDNQPLPFKVYPDRDAVPLPRELPESTAPATEVLSGRAQAPPPASALDLAGLTRLLFFSAGVTRILRGVLFRAAPSAGALYPTELYAVCGRLPDLPAGVYHFEPAEFVLRRLRDSDHRAGLAGAAAEPAVARSPLCLVLTGIPWRTTWKYGPRGYRHLFWDAGAIAANLLALAAAAGLRARVLLGFADAEVARLAGIGDPEEFPLALVTVETPATAPAAGSPPVEPIRPRSVPLSRSPRAEEAVTAAQRAGELASAKEVTAWRERARATPAQPATPPSWFSGDWALASAAAGTAAGGVSKTMVETIEAVILRRGSTRSFAREALPGGALRWAMAAATQPVPADFVPPGATLLDHDLVVHALDGLPAGAYRWREGDLELLGAASERRRARSLCLGQDLCGDAAAVAFHNARLGPILGALGPRGYRAAQLEAGIVAERLQLAAFALGFGATGVTFLDDDVSAFFGTDAAPMLAVAVGVPAYRGRPGRRPAELPSFEFAER